MDGKFTHFCMYSLADIFRTLSFQQNMQWLLPSNLDEDLNLFQIIKKTFELYMKS